MAIPTEISRATEQKNFHRRTLPGDAPGTLISDQTEYPTEIHAISFGPDGVDEVEIPVSGPFPTPRAGRVLWVNVTGLANADVIAEIGKHYSLHPLALEDVLHVHQRAKVEQYNEVLFVVARMLYEDEKTTSEQVSIFLGDHFLISFQEDPGDCFAGLRQRIREKNKIVTKREDYLLYAMIDAIIDGYFPKLEEISSELDDIDESMEVGSGREQLSRLHIVRRQHLYIRRLLWQHRDAVNILVRQENEFVSKETQVYLRDCLDHLVQLLDVSEVDRETCLSLQELAIAEVGLRTNDVMRVLTLMTTVFMPLTLIAGIYGMNFDPDVSPYNIPELKWYFGYPFALGLMAVLMVVMLGYFWIQGWFKS